MTWRDKFRPIVAAVIAENAGADQKALRKALRDADGQTEARRPAAAPDRVAHAAEAVRCRSTRVAAKAATEVVRGVNQMKLDVIKLMRVVGDVRGPSKGRVRLAMNAVTWANWREYLGRFAQLDKRVEFDRADWVKTWSIAVSVLPVGAPRIVDLAAREKVMVAR